MLGRQTRDSRARAVLGVAAWGTLAVVFAALLAAGVGGCVQSTERQGTERGVTAAYGLGTLKADLPADVPVLTVRAAAEDALRSRGYLVTEASGTEDAVTVRGGRAGDGPLDGVRVESWLTNAGTRVSVRVQPFGDEASSRAVLDAILTRLGR